MADKVPRWSPDGSLIAFRSERDGNSELYVMASDGSDQRPLTAIPESQQYRPHWSPDGARISFVSSSGIPAHETESYEANLYVIDADGSNQVLVDSAYGGFWDHDPWSPDGSRLAYVKLREGLEIWMADLEDGARTYLTDGSLPAWSPEGSTIAFGCLLDHFWDLCAIGADGSGLMQLNDATFDDNLAQWSPDGSRIAFWSWREFQQDLYVINPDGTGERQLTEFGGGHTFEWAPDGSVLVFSAKVEGNWDIFAIDLEGGEPLRLTDDTSVEGWPQVRP